MYIYLINVFWRQGGIESVFYVSYGDQYGNIRYSNYYHCLSLKSPDSTSVVPEGERTL